MHRCPTLQAARADNVAALRAIPGVTVVLRDAELRRRHENSRCAGAAWWQACCSGLLAVQLSSLIRLRVGKPARRLCTS